jgi:hypothetical protein
MIKVARIIFHSGIFRLLYCGFLVYREHPVVSFESEETQLRKLRDRLRQMSDKELVKFGKSVRCPSEPRVSVTLDPWKAQVAATASERMTRKGSGRRSARHRFWSKSQSKVRKDRSWKDNVSFECMSGLWL